MAVWKALNDLTLDNSYARLPHHFYHKTQPTPLPDPQILSINKAVAEWLELNPCQLNQQSLAPLLSGQILLKNSDPLAMKYAGHQFGMYNPELGDGRGLLLAEVLTSLNERLDLHLKGAGQTNYSRFADGRAVVRSSVREYLVGEALTALHIPSTRALALCASPEPVQRESREPAATILRVSPCHVRFGHFEHFYYSGLKQDLAILADYCLQRFYPECQKNKYPVLAMFQQICQRTASLVAGWQAYGFLHGVLNTDNMSIIGETFDHGPFAFIDRWDEQAVYNHTDQQGRYAFSKQPGIVQWNLACLAQALSPLIIKECHSEPKATEKLQQALTNYQTDFSQHWLQRMRQRLGLTACHDDQSDHRLIQTLRQWWHKHRVDFHFFLRQLSENNDLSIWLEQTSAMCGNELSTWLEQYQQRLKHERPAQNERLQAMQQVNPMYIFRTHIAQQVIDQVHRGNFEPLHQALNVLQSPFVSHPVDNSWLIAPESVDCVQLSCSS